MRCSLAVLSLLLSHAAAMAAEPADLGFRPGDEPGHFAFDTGVLRGTVRMNGHSQGIVELVHVGSGVPVVAGGRLPGALSPYRVFSRGVRYGNAARDWPTETKVLDDGALRVFWKAGEVNPLEITAVYRWTRPDTLDLELAVTPKRDMPDFELFMSSYFEQGFFAKVYAKADPSPDSAGKLLPTDRTPDAEGGYVMFPRDEDALRMIRDGRWKIPPSPVDWWVDQRLAAPLALRRDRQTGITAVMMSLPDDCFAVSSPFNPGTPTAGGYRSLYQSLFGRDLAAGRNDRVRLRLIVGEKISDEEAVRMYGKYLDRASPGGFTAIGIGHCFSGLARGPSGRSPRG